MDAPKKKIKVMKPKPVFVTKGLKGQDEHIDVLKRYFDEMKKVTVEPACRDMDLVTFAESTLWFGVIAIRGEKDCSEVLVNAVEEGTGADPSRASASNVEAALKPKQKLAKLRAAPPAPVPRSPSPDPFEWGASRERYNPIGLIYLATNYDDPLHLGECTLGFYVDPAHRHRPRLSMALDAVAAVAFRDLSCHRVQAIVVDNPEKFNSLQILANGGFSQEGVRRHAFFSPVTNEYKSLHYLAMLAMEWSFDLNSAKQKVKPQSLWDEILSRHLWEKQEMLRQEERSLKRTHSMETIREPTSVTAAAGEFHEEKTTISPSERRALLGDLTSEESDPGFDSDWSIVSSLARFSLPSSVGSSDFSSQTDVREKGSDRTNLC